MVLIHVDGTVHHLFHFRLCRPLHFTNGGPYRQRSKEGGDVGQAGKLKAKGKASGGLRGMLSSARSLGWGKRKGGIGVTEEEEDGRVSEQGCIFGQLGMFHTFAYGIDGNILLVQGSDVWLHLPRVMGAKS